MPQPSKNAVGSGKHSSLGQSAVLGIDPSPFCVQTAVHTGLGTGIFFAITLVIGAVALAAYSYFRLHRRTTGFQRFEVGGFTRRVPTMIGLGFRTDSEVGDRVEDPHSEASRCSQRNIMPICF